MGLISRVSSRTYRDMGSKSSKNSQTSQNDEILVDKKGFNISDTVKNSLETHDPKAMDCSTEKLTKSTSRRKLLTFIYHRPSSLFADDDDMQGHEFYEESRRKNNGKWCLKRVARRHLHHLEFEKLAKPFINMDCPAVLLSDEQVERITISHKNSMHR